MATARITRILDIDEELKAIRNGQYHGIGIEESVRLAEEKAIAAGRTPKEIPQSSEIDFFAEKRATRIAKYLGYPLNEVVKIAEEAARHGCTKR